MPKSFFPLVIGAGLIYLLFKQLPTFAGSLSTQNPLIRPIQPNLNSSLAIAGAGFGALATISAALSKTTPVAAAATVNAAVEQAVVQKQQANGIFTNAFEQAAQEAGNSAPIVPTLPAPDPLPAPVAFSLPTVNDATLASVIGSDLPISAASDYQGLTADLAPVIDPSLNLELAGG